MKDICLYHDVDGSGADLLLISIDLAIMTDQVNACSVMQCRLFGGRCIPGLYIWSQ